MQTPRPGEMWLAFRPGHWQGGRPALVTSSKRVGSRASVNICVTFDIEHDKDLLCKSHQPVPHEGGGAGVCRSFSDVSHLVASPAHPERVPPGAIFLTPLRGRPEYVDDS